MKFLCAAAVFLVPSLLYADGGHPLSTGPLPPDPITVGRVAGPHTAASLAMRQLTTAPATFLWELLRDTETLTTPQVRSLALDLLRVRRFYDADSPQDWLVCSVWAGRDPAGAARELLNIPDWEDREDNIGDYDSDVEFLTWIVWRNLAARDFPAAAAMVEGLQGFEATQQFFGLLTNTPLTPAQAARMARIAETKQPHVDAKEFAERQVHTLHKNRGTAAAGEFVRMLPRGSVSRKAAADALARLSPNDGAPDFAFPETANATLAALYALDVKEADASNSVLSQTVFPMPLYHAVRALPSEQARALAAEIPAPRRQAGWLHWLLMCQAAGDSAQDSQPLTNPPPGCGWIHAGNVPLSGLGLQLTKLAAQGQEPAAFLAARALRLPPLSRPAHETGEHRVLYLWALRDFPAALAAALAEPDKDHRSAACYSLAKAAYRLPYSTVLPHLTATVRRHLALEQPWWVFLPLEDREAAWQFMRQPGGDDNDRAALASGILSVTVRTEPGRSAALARELELPLEHIAGPLARHWPDRLIDLLGAEADPAAWRNAAGSLARYHPRKVIAILKKQPHGAAWEDAAEILAQKHPDIVQSMLPHLSPKARETSKQRPRKD